MMKSDIARAQEASWYPVAEQAPHDYKGYKIIREGNSYLYLIQSTPDGNDVPQALRGHFTGLEICKSHIDAYLEKPKKEINEQPIDYSQR
jgi:hypothetical protein